MLLGLCLDFHIYTMYGYNKLSARYCIWFSNLLNEYFNFLQVILCNKGDIDAVFRLVLPNTQFGPQFSFYPSQGIVIPGGYQAIQVKHLLSLVLHSHCNAEK